MESKLILGYWDLRGLGQRCKLVLKYLNIPFTEQIYGVQSLDQRKQWFEKRKPQMLKQNPAANLPYLIDSQTKQTISQSDAVIVYTILKANKPQLLGRNAKENVKLHTTMGVFRQLYSNYLTMIYNSKPIQETKQDGLKTMNTDLVKLSGLLGQKQFFCGEITWPDFAIAQFCEHIFRFEPSLKNEYKNLAEHQERIWNLPEIKDYVNSQQFKKKDVNYRIYAKWY